jgi:GH24 family phage-related lysozyme (muramidase)
VTKQDIANQRTITNHEAEAFLRQDLEDAVSILRNSVDIELNPYQFGVLVSFVYNVGGGRRASPGDPGKDGFVTLTNGAPSTLRRKINMGDYAGAALEFHKWVYAAGKRLDGLVSRRAEEAALFCREASVTAPQPTQPVPMPPTAPPSPPVTVLVNQPSAAPTRKWTYGAIGGGITGLISFMFVVWWNTRFPEDQIPPEYVAALPTSLTYLGILITQYMTKNKATDIPPG